jgi:glycosyltransferase involved in cell wall biosynthesis
MAILMARILYLWQAAYPWEIRVEKICRALRRAGHEVTIMARGKPGQSREEILDDIRIVRVGLDLPRWFALPISFNPVWHWEIDQAMRTWKPAVVIAREVLLAETAARVSHRYRKPLVIDMAEHYPASMRSWKKYQQNPLLRYAVFNAKLPDYVEKRAVGLADGILTVCHEQNRRLHESFDYPWNKMAVVENTPDLDVFAAAKKGPALPARTFAYHGTMTAQRGLDNLVKGFALAVKRDPDIRLVLAGGGESYDDLVNLSKECRVADKVHFTGRFRYEDLVRLYGETDIGVVPQPPDESCDHTIPNKLYDYLACGKPVIVSPARPLRRVVEETHTGLALPSCAPEAIAQGILDVRHMNLPVLAENALRAAREKYHWSHDVGVMMEFLGRYF